MNRGDPGPASTRCIRPVTFEPASSTAGLEKLTDGRLDGR